LSLSGTGQVRSSSRRVAPDAIKARGFQPQKQTFQTSSKGYLLVCRKGVNSSVTNMFENLRKNCSFGYGYEIWKGNELKSRIRDLGDSLIQRYFPKHFEYLRTLERKIKLENL